MTYSKANMRAVDKYVKNNYDRIEVKVPKGRKQAIEAYAKEHNQSVNALVNGLLQGVLGMSDNEWNEKPGSI